LFPVPLQISDGVLIVIPEADNYAKNHHIRSQFHAIILCRVVCDKPQLMHQADHSLVAPSSDQYNCVRASFPTILMLRRDANPFTRLRP
jgi:hypothetical protein